MDILRNDAVHRLVKRVYWICYTRQLHFAPGVVAVSGGADSVALLRALKELHVPNLTVAHINHGLRGEASDGDEEFVHQLADELKYPFECKRLTLPKNENLESAARRERYAWLKSLPCKWIATGHTADDQAETVLHRIIRGTGLQGLRGIHQFAERVIRPLLDCTRADVLDYLQSLGQLYRTDATNSEMRFTRNRIRHEVLPLLKQFNPDVVGALNRVARQASVTQGTIQELAGIALAKFELESAGKTLIFDGHIFLHQTLPLIRREAVRLAWRREGWPEGDMNSKHWRRLGNAEPGDYPGGIRLTSKPPVVQLGPRS